MLWVKAFHIIAVVCWFAGLFYLPRLFVYHSMTSDEVSLERFKVMERKLYRGIMTPSAVIATALGIWMLVDNWSWTMQAGWMHAKLLLVVLLIGYHLLCRRYLILFRDDLNPHGDIFYRVFNEIPVLILVGVVILAVVKPF